MLLLLLLVRGVRQGGVGKSVTHVRSVLQGFPVRGLGPVEHFGVAVQVTEGVVQSVVRRTVLDSLFQSLHGVRHTALQVFQGSERVVRVRQGGIHLDRFAIARFLRRVVPDRSLELPQSVPQKGIVRVQVQAFLENGTSGNHVAFFLLQSRQSAVDARVVGCRSFQFLQDALGEFAVAHLVGVFGRGVHLLDFAVGNGGGLVKDLLQDRQVIFGKNRFGGWLCGGCCLLFALQLFAVNLFAALQERFQVHRTSPFGQRVGFQTWQRRLFR